MAVKNRPIRFTKEADVTSLNMEKVSLHYDQIIIELQERIDAQDAEIEELKARVSALEAAI